MNRRWISFASLALSGCAFSRMPGVHPTVPVFAPIAFFAGHTRGDGELRVMIARPRAIHIEGTGIITPDGNLELTQRIEEDGRPSRSRRWSLRSTGPGTYAAKLSDAIGPVVITVSGNLLHIKFRAHGGLSIEQWLTLQPGGLSLQNHLVLKKFGIRAGVLDETIRKID